MSSYTITILLAIVFLPSVEAGVAVVCNTSTVATDIVTNCSAAGLYDLSFGINSNTTILDLSHNLLTGIPPGVAVLLHLSQLFLHGNNITEVKVPRELNLSQLSVL
jgi:Leucine-rich repeat (LRR) protein